jgi:hypothetical protein
MRKMAYSAPKSPPEMAVELKHACAKKLYHFFQWKRTYRILNLLFAEIEAAM